jgi:hypothetical protein
MMSVRIANGDIARVKTAIEGTGRNLRKELVIAVNKTAKKTQSGIARQLSSVLNLKQKISKRGVKITRGASTNDISARVEVSKDKRFNLVSFTDTKQTDEGVSYKVMKKGPRRIAKGAFEVGRWGGRAHRRKTKERGPLRGLRGPSAWGVFVVGKMIQPTAKETEAALLKEINNRIRFLELKKAGTI